jgi:hypothetical protein
MWRRFLFVLSMLTFANSVCSASAGIPPGQWYDRTHSGHGLDLNRAGATLFGTFFTYASDGSPEWLWLITPNDVNPSGDLTRFQKLGRAAPEAQIIGNFSLAVVTRCSDGIARPGATALLEFRFTLPQGTQRWCMEPLLPAATVAESALDGHWFMPASAAEPDFGWGLVTHYYPDTSAPGTAGSGSSQGFHMFYFYDALGKPRR